MGKVLQTRPGAPQAVVEGLKSLPDPGEGKMLIVVVRATSVRLRMVRESTTIEEQDGKAGGAGE